MSWSPKRSFGNVADNKLRNLLSATRDDGTKDVRLTFQLFVAQIENSVHLQRVYCITPHVGNNICANKPRRIG